MKTLLVAAISALLLAACAGPGSTRLDTGLAEADLRARWGEPTGRYLLPGGATRLEYASGPYGLETWMVDLDGAGRVTAWRQVLDYGALNAVQGRIPGMTREEVLRTLGRPGEVRSGGRQGGQVWSWRFRSPFCLWFQVGMGDDGRAVDAVFAPDPLCDDVEDR